MTHGSIGVVPYFGEPSATWIRFHNGELGSGNLLLRPVGVCCVHSAAQRQISMPTYLFRVVLALGIATGAVSQTAQRPCGGGGVPGMQSLAIWRTGVNSPYSLTASLKMEQTLPDGTTISGFTTSRQARDSRGRTLVDEPLMCQIDQEGLPFRDRRTTIVDAVAKTSMEWSEWMIATNKIATVYHVAPIKLRPWPTPQQEYNSQQRAWRASGVQFQMEDIGKRNIAGLQASGMRITRTFPPGSLGNSLPLTYVEERWNSDDYGIYLLDILDDPQFGRTSYEVIDFTPGEPDASLFQPPADYKIENYPTASQ
jgi:hypothetical protein